MQTKFKLEKDVPMPLAMDGTAHPGSGAPRKYPFHDMEVSNSFAVMGGHSEAGKVRAAANMHGRRWKQGFAVRRDDTGAYRCWRTS